MAKKKIMNKTKKTDWKFITLLLCILLVGLSVLALNQRTAYRSDAATPDCAASKEICLGTDGNTEDSCHAEYIRCSKASNQCGSMKNTCVTNAAGDAELLKACNTDYANCAGGGSKKDCIVVGTANGKTRKICGKSSINREFNRINKKMGW